MCSEMVFANMYECVLYRFEEKIDSDVKDLDVYKKEIMDFCSGNVSLLSVKSQVVVVEECILRWMRSSFSKTSQIKCLWHIYKNDIDESFWEKVTRKKKILFRRN